MLLTRPRRHYSDRYMGTSRAHIPPGYRVVELADVDSTNAEALRRVSAGETGPMWIRADAQLAGRGRKGRGWVSKPGNLYATLLLSLDVPVAALAQLGFVAALAIYDLAEGALGSNAQLSLKWPNDVLLAGEKLSGILTETLNTPASTGQAVAIGCGVNLQHAPSGTRYGATSLAAHGCEIEPDTALGALMPAFAHWLDVWQTGNGFTDIRNAWMGRSRQVGKDVTMDLGASSVTGLFEGLAEDGALVLGLHDGTQRVIRAGDVVHTQSQTRSE